MASSETLTSFFSKSFEAEINDRMLSYSYSFEYEKVHDYISKLLSIPFTEFINYIVSNYNVSFLEATDVFQFSNFDDCTVNICRLFKEAGDKGFTMLEIGKMLESDGIDRKDGAYTKYGENQSKTAAQFGLLVCLSNKFFLSCLGFIINDIDDKQQEKLIKRLLLRNKLVQRLLYKAITKGKSSYVLETGFLSEKTRLRRKSNVKKVVHLLCSTDECDLTGLLQIIEF